MQSAQMHLHGWVSIRYCGHAHSKVRMQNASLLECPLRPHGSHDEFAFQFIVAGSFCLKKPTAREALAAEATNAKFASRSRNLGITARPERSFLTADWALFCRR